MANTESYQAFYISQTHTQQEDGLEAAVAQLLWPNHVEELYSTSFQLAFEDITVIQS